MYNGQRKKTVRDIKKPLSYSKDARTGNPRYGRAGIINSGVLFTEYGKDWVTNEFASDYLFNLHTPGYDTIASNTGDTVTVGAAHNLANDYFYYISPDLPSVTASTFDVMPISILRDKISIKRKVGRNLEHPIGGYQYAVDDTVDITGSLEGSLRSENMFMSWLGAVCGWIDYTDECEVHFYDSYTNNFDHCQLAISYDASAGGGTYTNNTTYANDREPAYTTFNIFSIPAGTSGAGDKFLLMGSEIYNAIYFDFSTVGVTPPNIAYYYWNGAWQALTDYIYDDGTDDLIQNGAIKFTPPMDWVADRFADAETTTIDGFGYAIKAVIGGAFVTEPRINYIKLSYINPTFTVYEHIYSASSPEMRATYGIAPLKFTLTYDSKNPVKVSYDLVGKDQVEPTSMATAVLPTPDDDYKQRIFYSPKDTTFTWSNPSLTDISVRSAKLLIDTKGDAIKLVDHDNGLADVHRNTKEVTLEVETDKRGIDLLRQYYADPNTNAGQNDLSLVLHKEWLIASALQADPIATDHLITLTAAEGDLLHKGQVIAIKESNKIYYNIVESIAVGTVNVFRALGYNFSTAADVYAVDYYKFNLTNCVLNDPDDLGADSGKPEMMETFVLKPIGASTGTEPLTITMMPANVT